MVDLVVRFCENYLPDLAPDLVKIIFLALSTVMPYIKIEKNNDRIGNPVRL